MKATTDFSETLDRCAENVQRAADELERIVSSIVIPPMRQQPTLEELAEAVTDFVYRSHEPYEGFNVSQEEMAEGVLRILETAFQRKRGMKIA